MSQAIPKSLLEAIDELAKLPGVGPRSAERYAYFLLKSDPSIAKSMSQSLAQLHQKISYCPKTFALIETGQKISPLYEDPRRNKKQIAVVADPFDVAAIEKTGAFQGTYHVLGGLVSPIDGVGPEQLRIKELAHRAKEDAAEEIILATNASVEGESTALLISQQLASLPVRITRLARGLPIGVDLEYADQITLARALEGRQAL